MYNKVVYSKKVIYEAEPPNCRIHIYAAIKRGDYSVSTCLASSQKEHSILHWMNDTLIIRFECTSVISVITGLPMQSIRLIEGK